MAGVANAYPFFWPTARWLAEHWPGALRVDWDNLEDADGVASLLKLLMPRAESPALEELPLTARQWVRHLKRDDEGDGTFLVRRFAGDRGQNLVVGAQPGYRGQIMRGMTRKAKARVELAKVVVA